MKRVWWATWFEIWKWIQFGEPARRFGITDEELRGMMGEDLDSVQGVGHTLKRASHG